MNKILVILLGIMIATAATYVYALSSDLMTDHPNDYDDVPEEVLFAGSIVGYVIIGILMVKSKSKIPHIIGIIGSIVLIILYFIVISPMAEAILGADTEEVSAIGMICKILQFAVVIVSGIHLVKSKK